MSSGIGSWITESCNVALEVTFKVIWSEPLGIQVSGPASRELEDFA